jgi:hypothetical protein
MSHCSVQHVTLLSGAVWRGNRGCELLESMMKIVVIVIKRRVHRNTAIMELHFGHWQETGASPHRCRHAPKWPNVADREETAVNRPTCGTSGMGERSLNHAGRLLSMAPKAHASVVCRSAYGNLSSHILNRLRTYRVKAPLMEASHVSVIHAVQ